MSCTPIPPLLRDKDRYKRTGETERQAKLMPNIKYKILRCPTSLTIGAKKEWKRIYRIYNELDIPLLNDLDLELLKSYCINVDIREKLYCEYKLNSATMIEDTTDNTAETLIGDDVRDVKIGKTKKQIVNPILAELRKIEERITRLSEQLCLTPIGRARMAIQKEKSIKNDLETFYDD